MGVVLDNIATKVESGLTAAQTRFSSEDLIALLS
jgi:hypothetical protein